MQKGGHRTETASPWIFWGKGTLHFPALGLRRGQESGMSSATPHPPPGPSLQACAGARREPWLWQSPHQIRLPRGRWGLWSRSGRGVYVSLLLMEKQMHQQAFPGLLEPQAPDTGSPQRGFVLTAPQGSSGILGVPCVRRPALRGPPRAPSPSPGHPAREPSMLEAFN